MERWRDGVQRPPPRRCRDYPSFSSTLLDAIYRSIDEMDERGAAEEKAPCESPCPVPARKKNAAGVAERRKTAIPSVNYPAVNQPLREQPGRRRCTSSSSDGSSYGSFSSSDPESVPAAHLPRLRPIRTSAVAKSVRFQPADGPHPVISSTRIEEKRGKKEPHGPIGSRLRDLMNGRAPASPGARLANFLNSLFAVKSKASAATTSAATAASFSQSCLRKTPAAGKRTVRFCPVSVVVGDNCRPCGEKCVYGGGRPPAIRRTVVEEDDDVKSDSSSDLFELKNLAAIGLLRHEPPVYGTTRVENCSTKIHTPYEEIGRRQYKERK